MVIVRIYPLKGQMTGDDMPTLVPGGNFQTIDSLGKILPAYIINKIVRTLEFLIYDCCIPTG